jgi:hypothetical protein
MTKLHQILAVEKDIRQSTNRTITDGYQLLQKPQLLSGIARNYTPKSEEDDPLPSESTKVQANAKDVLAQSKVAFNRLWDAVATKDYGNTHAVADIEVDGQVLATSVPATHLLWLEKELNDLHTIISKLPVLDPTEDWSYSEDVGAYQTSPVHTTRSKKVPKVLTLAQATDKFPAQVETYQEDVIVGTWETKKFSGALPADEVSTLLKRVYEVREAVKVARSKANDTDVDQKRVAGPILDYIFG